MTDDREPVVRIQGIVRRYLARFPAEKVRLAPLLDRMVAPEGLLTRHSMSGHVTGSAFVVDPPRACMLLVHHGTLDRWLQPGGHLEAGEGPRDGAAREVWEETGLQRFTPSDWAQDAALPLDIDPHMIPANAVRGERQHYHFDFRYLFTADSTQPLAPQDGEVKAVRWVHLESLTADDPDGVWKLVLAKLREVLPP